MKISAIHRLTLLDFPKTPACIAFLPGCNFRCHYCHNSEFVLPEKLEKIASHFISEEAFFHFLDSRKGLLEGVVVSGGEPTIHSDLPDFMRKIREHGFQIKLDTNGSNSKMLEEMIAENLIDYVAMDIKASPQKYAEFCGKEIDVAEIEKSKNLLKNSKIDYEFRTTLVREFHDDAEFLKILEFLRGAKTYFLQNFRGGKGTLHPDWEKYSGFSETELQERKRIAEKCVEKCEIRI